MIRAKRRCLVFLSLFALAACKQESITSYRAPKLRQSADAPAAVAGQSGRRELEWKLPKGWTEQPSSEMRFASFSAPGKSGRKADVSIVVLGGDAGGDLANINRWRGQLNLEPVPGRDLARLVKTIKPGGRSMTFVNFVTKNAFIDNRYKKRLIAAIYPRGSRTWFFKVTGDDETVAKLQPAFMDFLAMLKFND